MDMEMLLGVRVEQYGIRVTSRQQVPTTELSIDDEPRVGEGRRIIETRELRY
jgi:hypothetical protein